MSAARLLAGCAAVAAVAAAAAPVRATTLVRAGLERLTDTNETVVIGEVLDARSYWNDEGSYIFTDVRVAVLDTLKGDPGERELTVTLMGGEVGDLTALIVGGAELVPGGSYVLFVGPGDLPGARGVRTVPAHAQGVFDLVVAGDEVRAVSQASRMLLVADAAGRSAAPGGEAGLAMEELAAAVRDLARRQPLRKGVGR